MHPMQLKTQYLWYFMDAASSGSFTRAAEKNFTSQSNISYAIRELERTLDVQLFLRRNNDIILTKYGEAFLPYVQACFAQIEAGCKALYEMSNPTSGNVRIGFSYIFSLSVVPELFQSLYSAVDQSGAQLDLHPMMAHVSDNVQCVEDMLLDGTCDLGLTCVHVRSDVEAVCLGQQEHVLLLPKGHPLAGEKCLSLEDVKDEPFILLNGDTETTGNYYIKLFDSIGLSPNLLNTGMDWLSLLVEVSAGKCLTIAPRCNLSGYQIAVVELEHPMKYRDLYLAWPRSRKLTPAAGYCRELILNYYGVQPY